MGIFSLLSGLIHMKSHPNPRCSQATMETTRKSYFDALEPLPSNLASENSFIVEDQTPNPFENLPVEILAEIFSKLDVDSLKSCRQVSALWNDVICCDKLFLRKVCAVHVALKYSATADEAKAAYFSGGSRLPFKHMRLRQIYSSKYTRPNNIFTWLTAETMKNVTHLDFRSSHILVSHFLRIVTEFENVSCLTISDDTLIWTPHEGTLEEHPDFQLPHWSRSKNILGQLATLRICHSSLHNLLQLFHRFDLLTFRELVELDLQGSSGLQSIFEVGEPLGVILEENSKTLKKFVFDGLPEEMEGTVNKLLANSDSSYRSELYSEFGSFLETLGEVRWNRLTLPRLEKLSLNRFPVANMCDNRVAILYSFLGRMTQLREVRFAQAYFAKDSHFDRFVSIFPKDCLIFLESVHLFAPTVELENIVQVLHPNQHILKYKDAFVQLQLGERLFWKINFLTWNSLENSIVQRNFAVLKKLSFHKVLFPVRDEEMQLLIGGGLELTQLHFDHCDLLGVTDSGLTGLSPGDCARVRADRTYEIRAEGFVGNPLNSMKRLRSLKLSNVGEFVTDTSALVAFKGLSDFKSLTIYQEPRLLISSKGIQAIKDNNPGIVVHYENSRLMSQD